MCKRFGPSALTCAGLRPLPRSLRSLGDLTDYHPEDIERDGCVMELFFKHKSPAPCAILLLYGQRNVPVMKRFGLCMTA